MSRHNRSDVSLMTELPARQKPPTIREVAHAAGVSTALVSIVFRGAPGASETTRARVFAAAEQLGYRANRTASLMKLRRTKHLGITMNVRSAFQGELAEEIQAAASQLGYQIVLSIVTAAHDESHAVETLLGFRCESVIMLGSQLPEARLLELAHELPLVLVGRRVNLGNVDVVRSADHRGQALVVKHLAGLGHRPRRPAAPSGPALRRPGPPKAAAPGRPRGHRPPGGTRRRHQGYSPGTAPGRSRQQLSAEPPAATRAIAASRSSDPIRAG